MEFMPVKVNKAIRSEKKHFFFDFKYLKSRSLPVKHAKKYRSPIAEFNKNTYLCNRKTGKSYTASSLRILQGLIAAKVVGCSGAI